MYSLYLPQHRLVLSCTRVQAPINPAMYTLLEPNLFEVVGQETLWKETVFTSNYTKTVQSIKCNNV